MAESQFTTEELKSEEWRPAPGYEDLYSVSSLGRVRRDKETPGHHNAGLILRFGFWDGYARVKLYRDGKGRTIKVHKLVARAFIGPCPDGQEVNHKDTNRANNRVDNLEYLTPSGNVIHAHRVGGPRPHGRGDSHWSRRLPERLSRGERHYNAKLTDEQVEEIRSVQWFYGINLALAEKYQVHPGSIKNIRIGRSRKHVH